MLGCWQDAVADPGFMKRASRESKCRDAGPLNNFSLPGQA